MSSAVLSSKILHPTQKKYFVHQASIDRVHWLSYNLSKGWLEGRGKAKDVVNLQSLLITCLTHGRWGGGLGTWGEAELVQKVEFLGRGGWQVKDWGEVSVES